MHARDFVHRAPDGAAEGAVRVAAAAVRTHDENQVLRLFDDVGEELRGRAGLLQLGSLRRDARDEQRKDGDERHGRGQIAEARRGGVRHDAAQPVVHKRQQRDRGEDDPGPRSLELLAVRSDEAASSDSGALLAAHGKNANGRIQAKSYTKPLRYRPWALSALLERQRDEPNDGAERETAVGCLPRRLARNPHRADHPDHDEALLQFGHELQRHRSIGCAAPPGGAVTKNE